MQEIFVGKVLKGFARLGSDRYNAMVMRLKFSVLLSFWCHWKLSSNFEPEIVHGEKKQAGWVDTLQTYERHFEEALNDENKQAFS